MGIAQLILVMKFNILTNALPRLDVSMIYGVVRDAGLGSSCGGATDSERIRMKVDTCSIFECGYYLQVSPSPPSLCTPPGFNYLTLQPTFVRSQLERALRET